MATQTIYTNKDAYVSSYDPSDNFGSSTRLKCCNYSGNQKYFYLEFDISSAPINPTSIILYLYRDGYTHACSDCTGKYRRITSSWSESSMTWNSGRPTTSDTHETQITYPNTYPAHYEWQSANVTNLYNDAKSVGSTLGLRYQATYSADNADFFSRETTYDPYIVITYTTEYDDYYVRTTGNDSLDGGSWTNAWKTINKAATTVTDGKTVHIGFGTYSNEPANNKIAPQNIGTSGIYYKMETAGGSGGTGSVIIEKN